MPTPSNGWIVRLIKPIPLAQDDFRADFFPRRFHYKRDAMDLKVEVEHKGGEAVVERAPPDGSPGGTY